MSKRQVAALGAVIVVPLAVLAIVLASLTDNEETADQGTQPAKRPSATVKSSRPGAKKPGPGQTGQTASQVPDTSLPVLDVGAVPRKLSGKLGPASSDGTIALGELEGTPILLNVWSADCLPCRAEAPVLQAEWERLGRRGVLFLGLNVLDSPAAARRFRAEHDVTYPSVEEKRGDTARSLGATGVPETFFVSKRGKVVSHVIGGLTLAQIQAGVRAAQTDQAIPPDQGGGRIPLP